MHEFGVNSVSPSTNFERPLERRNFQGLDDATSGHTCTSCSIWFYNFQDRIQTPWFREERPYSPMDGPLYNSILIPSNRSISATVKRRGIQNNNTDALLSSSDLRLGIEEQRYNNDDNDTLSHAMVTGEYDDIWRQTEYATEYTPIEACKDSKRCAKIGVLSSPQYSSFPRWYFPCTNETSHVTMIGKSLQLLDALATVLASAISPRLMAMSHGLMSPQPAVMRNYDAWATRYDSHNYTWKEGEILISSTLSLF